MNVKALRAFRAVVVEGTVSAAAKTLNLSQPALSRLIGLLESELGLRLFDRKHRRLILTAEGAQFEREARRILASLDEIPRIAAEIREHHTQRLRIITMPRTALSVVTPAVAMFVAENPKVEVSVDLRTHRDLDLWVGGRDYDLCFGNVPVSHRAAVGMPMVRTCLEVIMPRGHRFEAKDYVTPEDLVDERHIIQFPGLLLRRQTDGIFGSHDVRLNNTVLTGSSQIALHMVANGIGVTVIDPLSALTLDPETIARRPLMPTRWVVFGAIRQRLHPDDPLVDAMIDCLRRHIGTLLQPGAIERP